MSELEQVLAGDSAHTPPARILEGITELESRRKIPGAPHTIYQELWHIAFWQQMTLDWVRGLETPYPLKPTDAFPSDEQTEREPWDQLCQRFLATSRQAVTEARNTSRHDADVRCPSVPGQPTRTMTVREQLESLGAHNAYHFGRIVLLRQLLGLWPPPSGGFTW